MPESQIVEGQRFFSQVADQDDKDAEQHVFVSIYAFVKLERMKMPTSMNHFALRSPFEQLFGICKLYEYPVLSLVRA